jgi:hypothetical protein
MFKKAFKIEEPAKDVLSQLDYGIASTVGRAKALPFSLLVGQEKAWQDLKGPDKKVLQKELAHLQKDPRLKDVVVRLNHTNLMDDLKRIWSDQHAVNNPFKTVPLKLINTFLHASTAPMLSMRRADHYNPITNTVGLYSGIPEVAHHELGHARDFNNNSLSTPFRNIASTLEQRFLPFQAGPVTQLLESAANHEAEKGYKGDMREFRRRLWPARGTYWGVGLGTAAYALHPGLREKVHDFIAGDPGSYSDDWQGKLLKGLRGFGAGVALPAAGALTGRLFAEARNLFDRGGKKEKKAAIIDAVKYKIAKEILSGGSADKKKDKNFLTKELLKGTAHEKEHTSNKRMAKEIAKDHLVEDKKYYTKLEQAGL